MSAKQHTPGPWSAYGCAVIMGEPNHGGRANHAARYIGSSAPEDIDAMPQEEDLANASLMAAAPDLLAALEEIAHSVSSDCAADDAEFIHGLQKVARAAIAKAGGAA